MTKKNKHTPGSWRVCNIKANQSVFVIVGQNFRTADCICQISGGKSFRAIRNANLIAAAPDLLEALEAARNHLEYCGYGDSWERECAIEHGLEEKIESVIAKAKGQ